MTAAGDVDRSECNLLLRAVLSVRMQVKRGVVLGHWNTPLSLLSVVGPTQWNTSYWEGAHLMTLQLDCAVILTHNVIVHAGLIPSSSCPHTFIFCFFHYFGTSHQGTVGPLRGFVGLHGSNISWLTLLLAPAAKPSTSHPSSTSCFWCWNRLIILIIPHPLQ